MRAIRLVVALLLAAQSAAAQRVVLPAEAGRSVAPVPRLSAPALAVPQLSAPSLALQPSLLAAPAIAAPALVPAAKPASPLAAMSAALAEFAKTDLRSAPAADAKGAADALMSSVLGEAPAPARAPALGDVRFSAPSLEPSAPAPEKAPEPPRVHLLSSPLSQTAQLGRVAQVLHYAGEIGFQFGKAFLAWRASHSAAAALGLLAFELLKAPPMITAQSLADLGLRYWWAKLSTLRKIADVPGVTRVRVLTTGDADFSGILAVRKENTGLVFVDSESPLPASVGGLGAPISIRNMGERRVRLVLTHDGVSELLFWEPTLAQLLAGERMPDDVAAEWRERLKEEKKEKGTAGRVLDFDKEKALRVEAYLSDGPGQEAPLGAVAFGRATKRLIGASTWDRFAGFFGSKPRGRAIPLSDTVVERGGRRVVKGFWRRAWLRLTGGLIVRP